VHLGASARGRNFERDLTSARWRAVVGERKTSPYAAPPRRASGGSCTVDDRAVTSGGGRRGGFYIMAKLGGVADPGTTQYGEIPGMPLTD
jgi:hypothetical protein